VDRYNTFLRRVLAGLIDGVVLAPLPFLIHYVSALHTGVILFALYCVFEFSADWMYSVILHWRYGQTLGKKVMGIKVLDISESRLPTFRQALTRDAIYVFLNSLAVACVIYLVLVEKYSLNEIGRSLPRHLLTWIPLGWFILELTTMLTNVKRRAFQDWMAGTVVVRSA
jgi:uncharacterized RDD family membrane protein YckC